MKDDSRHRQYDHKEEIDESEEDDFVSESLCTSSLGENATDKKDIRMVNTGQSKTNPK